MTHVIVGLFRQVVLWDDHQDAGAVQRGLLFSDGAVGQRRGGHDQSVGHGEAH